MNTATIIAPNGLSPKSLPRPRIDGADRTRLLIEAAYELLADEGLDGLTIRAVLLRTGLARRAFYESFSGKDDLVLAVFEQTLKLAARHFEREAGQFSGALERLQFIVHTIVLGRGYAGQGTEVTRDRRGAALSREHMRLAESRPTDLQAALSPLLDLFARQLAEGMAAGAVRQADPARMAMLVYNTVSNTVHSELLAEEGRTPDPARRIQLADDIWDFCRRAIIA